MILNNVSIQLMKLTVVSRLHLLKLASMVAVYWSIWLPWMKLLKVIR